jgi:hypothetical protein
MERDELSVEFVKLLEDLGELSQDLMYAIDAIGQDARDNEEIVDVLSEFLEEAKDNSQGIMEEYEINDLSPREFLDALNDIEDALLGIREELKLEDYSDDE